MFSPVKVIEQDFPTSKSEKRKVAPAAEAFLGRGEKITEQEREYLQKYNEAVELVDAVIKDNSKNSLHNFHYIRNNNINYNAVSNEKSQSLDLLKSTETLHKACREGNLLYLRKHVSVDINTKDSMGRTPLISACLSGKYNLVRWLIERGARMNDVDHQGRSALHWSAYFGANKILTLLIKRGALLTLRDAEGRTPLHLSTGNFQTNCLKTLLNYVTDEEINEADDEGMTPLHWAVLHDRRDQVKLLLSRTINLRASDVEGKIPFHLTSSHPQTPKSLGKTSGLHVFIKDLFSKPSCAELFLRSDGEIMNVSDLDCRTPLHQACGENNIGLVSLMTSARNCDINAQDFMRRTALHWAAVAGYTQMLELLLERGADDSIPDESGATPLHYAASKNHSQCVIALLTVGVLSSKQQEQQDQNQRKQKSKQQSQQQQQRQQSTQQGKLPVRPKDRRPAYVCDQEGRYPLTWAVAKGHVQLCTILLDHNVDIESVDSHGATGNKKWRVSGEARELSNLLF